jgi:transketolase
MPDPAHPERALAARPNAVRQAASDVCPALAPGRSDRPQGAPGSKSERAIDQLCIDTIRTLSIDAVQKANSGHPGTAMAMAPVVYTLWQRFLRFDPADPTWPNRDRFVLSAGHASMLLYAILHLTGVKALDAGEQPIDALSVTLEDIVRFRQLDSKCTGHPEHPLTTGVEITTGPLGQGCAASVGMAIAGKWSAQHFNRPEAAVFDYSVYVLCSDGDMMEGVASEAASLAGHLMLGNLCWIYDNNRVTIEGHTDLALSEDVAARFLAYGWNVERVGDANDAERLSQALERFQSTLEVPTLIVVDSHIGFGSPHKHDTSQAHGEPLGEEEVRLTKRSYSWPEDAKFLVPDGVRENFQGEFGARGGALRAAWLDRLEAYGTVHPELAEQFHHMQRREIPAGWDAEIPSFTADAKGLATRSASSEVLNAIAAHYPWLIGGSADLGPSTKTSLTFEGAGEFEAHAFGGRNLHFGIREHAMAAILNGLAVSKVRAFGSTYLIFSDYLKPALRLSAMMQTPAIYIFTHDSIGVGEDGPTHQPVEQLISLRAVPGLITLRPADANEVVEAWRVVIALKDGPACLILSRQPVPTLDRARYAPAAGVARGAYVLADAKDAIPLVLLIGTGSEVALCVAAYERLTGAGVAARVISMPSWELFEQQDLAYRDAVLPPAVRARVSVEAASVLGWDHYVGMNGAKIGMRTFGASAPMDDLMAKFGFSVDAVVTAARQQIARAAEAGA